MKWLEIEEIYRFDQFRQLNASIMMSFYVKHFMNTSWEHFAPGLELIEQ